ncbi:hypothetical protein CHRY9390_02479 [Chryseobacterium aquaeductus]|uniref:Uncharacterized protein n=1 Tax=Chryseobacterium aquaeductus TaxID=2675056 RepID=A0A9N8MPX9_9FLAO|nr:hypothetical protein CHRY9390_02479 [Chryseobacterium potabilaquae]CAD7812204.1 hypothetical protein CHRY9390_02479 [Chryseobacterium aquaeductus]
MIKTKYQKNTYPQRIDIDEIKIIIKKNLARFTAPQENDKKIELILSKYI